MGTTRVIDATGTEKEYSCVTLGRPERGGHLVLAQLTGQDVKAVPAGNVSGEDW